MIIPIRCMTCGKVLADKYLHYKREVAKRKTNSKIVYMTQENLGVKSPEGEILDQLGLNHPCCRRHFLTHIDL
jgi:DNA-directed RNA polymerase subunit N (RpoN/RPB10)